MNIVISSFLMSVKHASTMWSQSNVTAVTVKNVKKKATDIDIYFGYLGFLKVLYRRLHKFCNCRAVWFIVRIQADPRPKSRGVRYPIWFNSIFEFCQKMIHSIFDSILLYPRFNSKYYSIQRKFCWFNSKDNSIQ